MPHFNNLGSITADHEKGRGEMSKIDQIVNDIYDPKIEDPEYQTLMRLCIKAWLHDAVGRGIRLGREDFALEVEKLSKKYMSPDAGVFVIGKAL